MSFGANLKRERELRGISLDEISKATKISLRQLEAIESDRFDILPEGVFRKSFIKSYTRYLGMSEEQVLQEYALQFEPSASLAANVEKPAAVSVNWPVALVIGLAALLALGITGFWYLGRGLPAEPAATTTSSPALPTTPIPAPTRVTVSEPAAETAQSSGTPSAASELASGPAGAASPGSASSLKVLGELAKKPESPSAESLGTSEPDANTPLELTIEATDQAWLSVRSGEKSLFSGLMNSQESRKFPLESPLQVVLGNAGGVKILVNGQAFASLGRSGERKSLEISADNYQRYLEPATQ